MIFTKKDWPGGFLIVCGSFWPGAYDGAPMPHGYPHNWRSTDPPCRCEECRAAPPSRDGAPLVEDPREVP